MFEPKRIFIEFCHQDGELTTKMIKQMVYINVMTIDKYLPGFLSVIYGGSNPSQEIEKIEFGS